MFSVRSGRTAIGLLLIGLAAALITAFVTVLALVAPTEHPQPDERFDVELSYVLIIALGAIMISAAFATLMQGIFSSSDINANGNNRGDLGEAFRRYVVLFAVIVGSVSGSYTVATIVELLINTWIAN